jgi:hypothetical protein
MTDHKTPPVHRLKVDAEHIKVEEDKLKIIWHAAGIEKWLLGRLTLCSDRHRLIGLSREIKIGRKLYHCKRYMSKKID